MNRKKLQPKALSTPNVFLQFKGCWDGRVRGTAAADPETGLISSGFLQEQENQYRAFIARQIQQLENDTKIIWQDASALLAEHTVISQDLDDLPDCFVTDTVDKARLADYTRHQRYQLCSRRDEVIRSLVQLDSKLRSRELITQQELAATAEALTAKLAVYCRGIQKKPIRSDMLPSLSPENAMDLYRRVHGKENRMMQKILQEVYEHG